MLVLTEDQRALAENAREVMDGLAPVARHRLHRDAQRTYDPDLWIQLIELGWAGLLVSEADGGLGMDLADLAVVMEAIGRNLAATPFLSNTVASSIAPDGVAEGRVVAFCPAGAVIEDGRITGEVRPVLDAQLASAFIVPVGDEVYLVEQGEVTPLIRLDHRDAGIVRFDDEEAVRLDAHSTDLEAALDRATVALCAEMLGAMSAVFEATLTYLKERVQFDVPIGSFQVLQHRAVDCFVAIELCRSVTMAAARDPSPELVSLAKARCNDSFLHIAKEAIQLHGGIGMTDDCDLGFYLKRAMVCAHTLGTSAYHRDRWARLRGY
jgi:alkylation response protein AidB-like acyl-CoA dehydrogenase